jgi:PAS domain S-box-containing protein
MELTDESITYAKRAFWLIRLRWAAALCVVIATFVASSILGIAMQQQALYVVGVLLACYNAGVWSWVQRCFGGSEAQAAATARRIIKVQISTDLVFLTLLLHFSGGVENPFAFFFVFHMIIASILLSVRESYVQASFAVLLFGLMVLLEHLEMVPHHCLEGFVSQCSQRTPLYVLGTFFVFAASLFLVVYMTSNIAQRRRQAEQALRVSRDYLARILDSMHEGLMVIDPDFVITDVNGRMLEQYGVTREEVLGRKCHQITHHADQRCAGPESICPVKQVLATAQRARVEHVHLDSDNVSHVMELHAFPLLGPDGKVTAVVELSHDITESKQAEAAVREANILLRQKDRIKDEYVRRVTHDIKGHLGAVQTCLDLVAGGLLGPLNDKQADFLRRAHDRTKSLVHFLRTLLRLTEIRLCDKLDMAVFSLYDSLNRVTSEMQSRVQEKSIHLNCSLEPKLDEISGNEFFFEEAVMHLLQNAIKYTPEHGTITIAATRQDNAVTVAITDTGMGIPDDDLGKVFDEFFRARNAKDVKPRSTGLGLGLSIVKQIVEKHQGHIDVESREGQGTTFRLTLPGETS